MLRNGRSEPLLSAERLFIAQARKGSEDLMKANPGTEQFSSAFSVSLLLPQLEM